MTEEIVHEKRRPGRPRKPVDQKPVDNSVQAAPKKFKMKAKPNWEDIDPAQMVDTPDRLKIDPEHIPDGMSVQWVTDSVYGQSMAQHRSGFERRGWTPVHPSDFDGQFDGMFTPKGSEGEIIVDGLVLMARPKQMTKRAEMADKLRAIDQVRIKEQAWKSGDIQGVTLDASHPTAVNSNRINRTLERIQIPED